MNKCKMCQEELHLEDEHKDDNICESCFADDFESLDLEDKLEVLLK